MNVEVGQKYRAQTGELLHVLSIGEDNTLDARVNGGKYCIQGDLDNFIGMATQHSFKLISDEDYKAGLDRFWRKRIDSHERME